MDDYEKNWYKELAMETLDEIKDINNLKSYGDIKPRHLIKYKKMTLQKIHNTAGGLGIKIGFRWDWEEYADAISAYLHNKYGSTHPKRASKNSSSRRTSSSKPKDCKDDEIRNPATGRCVKRNGKIGRKILGGASPKRRTSPKNSSSRRSSRRVPKDCKDDEIRNPATGKCVKRDGKIGRKILGRSPPKKSRKEPKRKASPRRRSSPPRRRSSPPKSKFFGMSPPKQMDSIKFNYYEILGVSKSATDSEIKKAYFKLAKELHPDKNPSPSAPEKFKKVVEAYSVLIDPSKRNMYDLNPFMKLYFN